MNWQLLRSHGDFSEWILHHGDNQLWLQVTMDEEDNSELTVSVFYYRSSKFKADCLFHETYSDRSAALRKAEEIKNEPFVFLLEGAL